MPSSYPYRPLAGSAIRLIRILEAKSPQDAAVIRCKLIHMPLAVSPPPAYIAISYVWGNPNNNPKTIQLDGHDVSVSENLWHALHQVRTWEAIEASRGYGPWRYQDFIFFTRRPWLFWADALCINQADVGEKSREIPRMTTIFSSAYEVFGWLDHQLPPGINHSMLNMTLDKARDMREAGIFKGQEKWHEGFRGTEANLRAMLGVDPLEMAVLTETLFRIAHLPWFRRLWIIQEFAVSQASVVLALGPHIFDARDFLDLLMLFTHRPEWFQKPVELACPVVMQRVRDRYDFHEIRDRATEKEMPTVVGPKEENERNLDAFALRLQGLLAMAANAPFRSSLDHDMIYGILGMAGPPDPMPCELAIDYSLPWPEVCRRYAKFIAEKTGSISFFTRIQPLWDRGATEETRDRIPSWVPDFSHQNIAWLGLPGHQLPDDHMIIGNKVVFSRDGRSMTLDGLVLGTPIALTRRRHLEQKVHQYYFNNEANSFSRIDALRFVEDILKPAADTQGQSLDQVLASWIRAWEHSLDRSIVDSEVPTILHLFKTWIQGRGPSEWREDDSRNLTGRGQIVWRRLKDKTRMKNWLVTPDGRGWMTLFLGEVKPDDVVVAFRGFMTNPAVLRRSRGDGGFQLVGMLIERVPRPEGMWETRLAVGSGFLKREHPWTNITLV
ncbi:heterokaryon incompatibility protein-domain-containing protein [Cercophora scortea]|uniref:Heterokaryon incompatibility protein-domain-containing protein n=1 Tax=Cercophora scortea TaxID=314031 RepID=A0AAE0INB4_9PEZI|nr:heterokaryon incompatibility protein-domain-containing protein [Cercophora scortea]